MKYKSKLFWVTQNTLDDIAEIIVEAEREYLVWDADDEHVLLFDEMLDCLLCLYIFCFVSLYTNNLSLWKLAQFNYTSLRFGKFGVDIPGLKHKDWNIN